MLFKTYNLYFVEIEKAISGKYKHKESLNRNIKPPVDS